MDLSANAYVAAAYKEKKWAFVSDYVRLSAVYEHGGVYLDTDVELIRNLDELLENKAFMGIEKQNCQIATGLGFGAEKGHPVLRELMDLYDGLSFYKSDGTLNLTACPSYTTELFLKNGFCLQDRNQLIGDVMVYASEYFCPMHYNTGKMAVTDNTFSIHWYGMSWYTENDRRVRDIEIKLYVFFPASLARPLAKLCRNTYRFAQYAREGTLRKNIAKKMSRMIEKGR